MTHYFWLGREADEIDEARMIDRLTSLGLIVWKDSEGNVVPHNLGEHYGHDD